MTKNKQTNPSVQPNKQAQNQRTSIVTDAERLVCTVWQCRPCAERCVAQRVVRLVTTVRRHAGSRVRRLRPTILPLATMVGETGEFSPEGTISISSRTILMTPSLFVMVSKHRGSPQEIFIQTILQPNETDPRNVFKLRTLVIKRVLFAVTVSQECCVFLALKSADEDCATGVVDTSRSSE
jgi:hypothetical protein